MANWGSSTNWYPDNQYVMYTSNTTSGFNWVTPTSSAPKSEKQNKQSDDPLVWLKRRVDEICELSGIAA